MASDKDDITKLGDQEFIERARNDGYDVDNMTDDELQDLRDRYMDDTA